MLVVCWSVLVFYLCPIRFFNLLSPLLGPLLSPTQPPGDNGSKITNYLLEWDEASLALLHMSCLFKKKTTYYTDFTQ